MTFVEKGKVVSKWFNLESAKHGALYLKLFWCTLSSSSMSVSRPLAFEQEWRSANRPVHSMLMVVFVDNVKDLPFPKSNTEVRNSKSFLETPKNFFSWLTALILD
jgi:hypothetical protein